jgi:hypothetical protein
MNIALRIGGVDLDWSAWMRPWAGEGRVLPPVPLTFSWT